MDMYCSCDHSETCQACRCESEYVDQNGKKHHGYQGRHTAAALYGLAGVYMQTLNGEYDLRMAL